MATSRLDNTAPDRSASLAGPPNESTGTADGVPDDATFLRLTGDAEDISKRHQAQVLQRPLARAYRAWRNEHDDGSKYRSPAWRGRSRLFVPKTRSAVRKNLAAAASALFSTADVVSVTAQYEDDELQRASAAVISEDLNYRLQRTSRKAGLPWFLIAMGANQDAQLTGVCCSKQYWEYEEVPTGRTETQMVEGDGGVFEEREVPVMKVVKDRPYIDLFPLENVRVDPAAPWVDPAQLGAWLQVLYPMHLSDIRTMMASRGKDGVDQLWREGITDADLLKGREPEDQSSTRRVREGGTDRYQDAKTPGDWDIVWIQENFVRMDGQDWQFWSVGRHALLSDPRPVEEAYPALRGERPYTIGIGSLDVHRVFPMSAVDSWQPLQLELNDVKNLRLDTLKRSIAPLPLVKRGKKVDLQQLQRRGQPDAVLLVDSPEDVTFPNTPGPPGQAFTESATMNAEFDELAGVFSTSSVQTNRQLNETVGGMQLMTGAANAVTEFDLRVWVETWVEPTLRHLVHMIQFYENDETVLAVAGSKARTFQKYGIDPSLDDLLQAEVTVNVNVGVGAADPMQKLGKLKAAGEMIAPVMPMLQAQGIKINGEAWIEEVFGGAGFKDGRRFFEFADPNQPAEPSPEQIEAEMEAKVEQEKIGVKREEIQTRAQTAIQVEQMRGRTKLIGDMMGTRRDMAMQRNQQRGERMNRMMEVFAGRNGESQAPAKRNGNASEVVAETAEEQQQMSTMALVAIARRVGAVGQQIEAANAGNARAQADTARALAAVADRLGTMTGQIGQLGEAVVALAEQQNAPVELIKDAAGRTTGIRKGNQVRPVVRDRAGAVEGIA